MKNLILLLLVILYPGFGEPIAQNLTNSSFISAESKLMAYNDISYPMPNWKENWSKESLKEIAAITKKHGQPYEISRERIIWHVNGNSNKTIQYTENFSLEIQEDYKEQINHCNPIALYSFMSSKN